MNKQVFLTLVLPASMWVCGCSSSTNEYVPPPPPSVTTAKPIKQPLTLFIERNGSTEPVEQADVRSRVRGFVEKIFFEPGQSVKADDKLYQIEDDIYVAKRNSASAAVEAAKASVSVAHATQATADAEVKKAESNFNREKRLLESNAGSQSTYESAVAARDSAAAQLIAAIANVEAEKANQLQAEAALAQAELDLEYTIVRAPIDGRVTNTLIKLGNLVELGTQLSTVVDQRKIFANFSISDSQLLDLMNANKDADADRNAPEFWSEINVFLQRDSRSKDWDTQGKLEYLDQRGIEGSTGTFALRAEFDNSKHELLPGMFVMVRLPVQRIEDAILIPERAISRTQMGKFLMIVGSDNKVERRAVTLGQKLDGWVMVLKGLETGESFVLDGLHRARAGNPVTPTETELSTKDSPILQASIINKKEE